MDEQLYNLVKYVDSLGYRTYRSFIIDDGLIITSGSKHIAISQVNLLKSTKENLEKSLKDTFDSMKPNCTFSKTEL